MSAPRVCACFDRFCAVLRESGGPSVPAPLAAAFDRCELGAAAGAGAVLDLRDCGVSDDHAVALARALRDAPAVCAIDARSNERLGMVGISALFSVVRAHGAAAGGVQDCGTCLSPHGALVCACGAGGGGGVGARPAVLLARVLVDTAGPAASAIAALVSAMEPLCCACAEENRRGPGAALGASASSPVPWRAMVTAADLASFFTSADTVTVSAGADDLGTLSARSASGSPVDAVVGGMRVGIAHATGGADFTAGSRTSDFGRVGLPPPTLITDGDGAVDAERDGGATPAGVGLGFMDDGIADHLDSGGAACDADVEAHGFLDGIAPLPRALSLASDSLASLACLASRRLDALVTLDISNNPALADAGLAAAAWAAMPALTELDASRTSLHRFPEFPPGFGLVVLRLRDNRIRSAAHAEALQALAALDLTGNAVGRVLALRELALLPCLRVLWLAGNPVAAAQGYRRGVIDAVRRLVALDGVAVTRGARARARPSVAAGTVVVAATAAADAGAIVDTYGRVPASAVQRARRAALHGQHGPRPLRAMQNVSAGGDHGPAAFAAAVAATAAPVAPASSHAALVATVAAARLAKQRGRPESAFSSAKPPRANGTGGAAPSAAATRVRSTSPVVRDAAGAGALASVLSAAPVARDQPVPRYARTRARGGAPVAAWAPPPLWRDMLRPSLRERNGTCDAVADGFVADAAAAEGEFDPWSAEARARRAALASRARARSASRTRTPAAAVATAAAAGSASTGVGGPDAHVLRVPVVATGAGDGDVEGDALRRASLDISVLGGAASSIASGGGVSVACGDDTLSDLEDVPSTAGAQLRDAARGGAMGAVATSERPDEATSGALSPARDTVAEARRAQVAVDVREGLATVATVMRTLCDVAAGPARGAPADGALARYTQRLVREALFCRQAPFFCS